MKPSEHSPSEMAAHRSPAATPEPAEDFGFLDLGGEQLYYCHHRPKGCRIGQVLLIPPFAFIDYPLHIAWVRWGRLLAQHGLEVLRFDYRGMGESTGELAKLSFADWAQDVRCCATWLRDRGDGLPLILHGIELGAILGAGILDEGLGDWLLAWSPPPSARDVLHYIIRVQRAAEFANRQAQTGGKIPDYITRLEAGQTVTVNGQALSPQLWTESAEWRFECGPAQADEGLDFASPNRRRLCFFVSDDWPLFIPGCRVVGQPDSAVTARVDPVRRCMINPDLTSQFSDSLCWITQCLKGDATKYAGDTQH